MHLVVVGVHRKSELLKVIYSGLILNSFLVLFAS